MGLRFRVLWTRVEGSGCYVSGLALRDWGLDFRVWGLGVRVMIYSGLDQGLGLGVRG